MAKFLHWFETENEFNRKYNGKDYIEPWVSYVDENSGVSYNKKSGPTPPTPSPYTFMPLTIEFTDEEDGDVTLREGIYYKLNDGEWILTSDDSGDNSGEDGSGSGSGSGGHSTKTVSVSNGDILQVKHNYENEAGFELFEVNNLNCIVYGNIMSMYSEEGFENLTSFVNGGAYVFTYLFRNLTGITSAENLILPVTTLDENCYGEMFSGCINLTTAPELPATTLASYCYSYMFRGCASLTTAPELPATALANNCYNMMFADCTSLATAPVLPATTLTDVCYGNMFQGCTSLTTAPVLPATTLANNCYSSMFWGCTSLTTAPELPATALANNCYRTMFRGCTALNYIKCLATDISATNCTSNWVNGVAATGRFITPQSTSWTTGNNGIPSGWTRENAS